MKTVYGVKMTDLDDILKYARGKVRLCDFLITSIKHGSNILDGISDDNKIIINTSSGAGDFAVHNTLKPYRMIFVPVELMEERLIASTVDVSLTGLSDIVTSAIQKDRIDEMKDKYEDRYESASLRFRGFDNIVSVNCVMFVYDDDKLIHVSLARPISIIENVINKGTEYECSLCASKVITDNKNIEGFLPDMRYEVKGSYIHYYCKSCQGKSKRIQHLPHVGE